VTFVSRSKHPKTLEEAIGRATMTSRTVYFDEMVIKPYGNGWILGPLPTQQLEVEKVLALFRRVSEAYRGLQVILTFLPPLGSFFADPDSAESWLRAQSSHAAVNEQLYKHAPSPWAMAATRRK
jgi:hypothetical protein